eukprot:TRINITY_DN43567_c0_g2_i5.p1 TRINITY_DN43567_c0_g2~~TRINITY_DN43567_c0_g2_i5.p1  ORF type:complete len:367 (-),score=-25.39 TRINITY_DN43567_c0_g2_i5:342-1442(-)
MKKIHIISFILYSTLEMYNFPNTCNFISMKSQIESFQFRLNKYLFIDLKTQTPSGNQERKSFQTLVLFYKQQLTPNFQNSLYFQKRILFSSIQTTKHIPNLINLILKLKTELGKKRKKKPHTPLKKSLYPIVQTQQSLKTTKTNKLNNLTDVQQGNKPRHHLSNKIRHLSKQITIILQQIINYRNTFPIFYNVQALKITYKQGCKRNLGMQEYIRLYSGSVFCFEYAQNLKSIIKVIFKVYMYKRIHTRGLRQSTHALSTTLQVNYIQDCTFQYQEAQIDSYKHELLETNDQALPYMYKYIVVYNIYVQKMCTIKTSNIVKAKTSHLSKNKLSKFLWSEHVHKQHTTIVLQVLYYIYKQIVYIPHY